MYTNKDFTEIITDTQPAKAFGASWHQTAMSLPYPPQASLAPLPDKAYTEASNADKAHSDAQGGAGSKLSNTERLRKRLLKFEQLLARSNVHWQKFWLSQTLDLQAQLAAITNGDPGLAGQVRDRLTEYEGKLVAAPSPPWRTFFLKEIKDCQDRLAELRSE
jgi:hypothetical protein